MSLTGVAQKSGYAVSTVSLVLSGRGDELSISRKAQERIIRAAEELGYQPNQLARALQSGKTGIIAVIGSTGGFTIRQMRQYQVASLLRDRGYRVMLYDFSWDEVDRVRLLREVMAMRPEGVIISEIRNNAPDLLKAVTNIHDKGTPIVSLDIIDIEGFTDEEFAGIDQVYFDRSAISYGCTRYLLELGHRSIRYVIGGKSPSNWVSKLRQRGYESAMRESGLQITGDDFFWLDSLPVEANNFEKGRLAVMANAFRDGEYTAVLAVNDEVAIGMLRGCDEKGLKVPDDVSIVGSENLPVSAYASVPLTTMAFPVDRVAGEAVDILMKRLAGWDGTPVNIAVEPRLVIRDSCRRI
ncbi:MAG: LacI family DNA-binding transcriptional regulator [bacterium]|nr:LacI family DNA-binding transcriptional regulator [bacterium]